MLRRFAVSGFRNLGEIDLELGKLNVVIGPNNGGKSNLCEAIESGRRFVSAGGHTGVDLTAALDDLGGVYLPNWSGDRRVSFRWSLDGGLDYQLAVDVPRESDRWQSDWRILAERVGWSEDEYAEPEGPNGETIVAHLGLQVRRIANAVGPRYGMSSSIGWRPFGKGSSLPSLEGALAGLSAAFDGSLFTSFAGHVGARDQRPASTATGQGKHAPFAHRDQPRQCPARVGAEAAVSESGSGAVEASRGWAPPCVHRGCDGPGVGEPDGRLGTTTALHVL